jgi:hypothetical protein
MQDFRIQWRWCVIYIEAPCGWSRRLKKRNTKFNGVAIFGGEVNGHVTSHDEMLFVVAFCLATLMTVMNSG